MSEEDGKPGLENQPEMSPEIPNRLRLTDSEGAAISAHINRKAVSPNDACPVCGSPQNMVMPDIFSATIATRVPAFGGEYQPLISTVCFSCGYVRFFNKIIVDLLIAAYERSEKSEAHSELEDQSSSNETNSGS